MIYEQFPGLWIDSTTGQIVKYTVGPTTPPGVAQGLISGDAGWAQDPSNPDLWYGANSAGGAPPASSIVATPTSFLPFSLPAGTGTSQGSSYPSGDGGGIDFASMLPVLGPAGGVLAKWLVTHLTSVTPAAGLGGTLMVAWAAIPVWGQILLIGAGIAVGTVLIIKGIQALRGGGGSASDAATGTLPGGLQVVSSWTANGVAFVRLADGRLGAQNKLGRWKFWRPKKPIVIYASGAGSIKQFIKADRALDKQAKHLRKALARRAPTAQRRTSSIRTILVEPKQLNA